MSVVNTYSILIQQLVGYPSREMVVHPWKSKEYDRKKNVIDTGMIPTNWLPKTENNTAHVIIHEHGGKQVDTLNNQW